MAEPLFTGRLSPEVLVHAVKTSLNLDSGIPAGAHGAAVVVVNHDRVEVVIGTRLVETEKLHWDLDVAAGHDWSGENQFSILSKTVW